MCVYRPSLPLSFPLSHISTYAPRQRRIKQPLQPPLVLIRNHLDQIAQRHKIGVDVHDGLIDLQPLGGETEQLENVVDNPEGGREGGREGERVD